MYVGPIEEWPLTLGGIEKTIPYRQVTGNGTAIFSKFQKLGSRAQRLSTWRAEHPLALPQVALACSAMAPAPLQGFYEYSFKALATVDSPWVRPEIQKPPKTLELALKRHRDYLWWQTRWNAHSIHDQANPPDFTSLKIRIRAGLFAVNVWAPHEWLWRNWFDEFRPANDWVTAELRHNTEPIQRVLLNVGYQGGVPKFETLLIDFCTGDILENCAAIQEDGLWRVGPEAKDFREETVRIFPALQRHLPWR